jgi:hypothetical protein
MMISERFGVPQKYLPFSLGSDRVGPLGGQPRELAVTRPFSFFFFYRKMTFLFFD